VHPFAKTAVGGAGLLSADARARYLDFINELSAPLSDDAEMSRLWEEECRVLLAGRYRRRLGRLAAWVSEGLTPQSPACLSALNLVRCDAHREALTAILALAADGRLEPDGVTRSRLEALMQRLKAFAA
jgi:hypothetical protein